MKAQEWKPRDKLGALTEEKHTQHARKFVALASEFAVLYRSGSCQGQAERLRLGNLM